MIKQIQLRGISRTPSDKMSEDGGLSESLNMYIDTAENAPAFIPQDVTEELGLPADLQAEKVFIHKTANYENYIVVESGSVVAYTLRASTTVKLDVIKLEEDEDVTDISSIGNTLIISTTQRMCYVLYRAETYSFLGTKIPFPYIDFIAKNASNHYSIFDSLTEGVSGDWRIDTLPEENAWNEDYESDKDSHSDTVKSNLLQAIWASIDQAIADCLKKGYIIGGVVIRYAVELYDGSLLSSLPILLDNGYKNALDTKVTVRSLRTTSPGGGNVTTVTNKYTGFSIKAPYYGIYAKLDTSFAWEDWKDLISSINIYISKHPLSPRNRKMSRMISRNVTQVSGESYNYEYEGVLRLGDKLDNEFILNLLDATSLTHIVNQSFYSGYPHIVGSEWKGLEISFSDLKTGIDMDLSRMAGIVLENQKIISGDDMKHYSISSNNLFPYNNRLFLCPPSENIAYDYNKLNAYSRDGGEKINYDIKFVIQTQSANKITQRSFSYDGGEVFAFQIFPDSRACKMLVKATFADSGLVKYGEFDMTPHPYLDCSYFYGGVENKLADLCNLDSLSEYTIDNSEELYNKVYVSKADNPFIFPLESRYTFQSKVLGVAIANTALSQGQFGQFPLYVFTEDGIWAMETASDGSFISQKPLSREVCVNPDSITSIDNAVVFVTDKGVMMIQGSQVMNISPYMNGRHYIPNESATSIIARQEGFSEFVNAIKDETPFVAFMKKAKIAYDYAGQRLICIADDETFQYIYKLDTQTWHKVAFKDFDLIDPLNSYPDCLVQGKVDADIKTYKIIEPIPSPSANLIRSVMNDFSDEIGVQLSVSEVSSFLKGKKGVDVTNVSEGALQSLGDVLEYRGCAAHTIIQTTATRIYSLGTILDVDPEAKDAPKVAKGILITRPFDLGMPDVFKSITSIKIRGDYDKGNVKYILQGSDDGKTFYTMNSLRGKSWKMFRLFILADLEPTERISWIDIDFEPRYNNRLR